MERRRWSVQLALLLAVAIVAKSSAGGAMDHDVDPRDVRIKELEQRLDAYEGRRLGQASLRNAAPEDLAVRVAALEKLVDSVNVKAVDDKVRGGHPPSPHPVPRDLPEGMYAQEVLGQCILVSVSGRAKVVRTLFRKQAMSSRALPRI